MRSHAFPFQGSGMFFFRIIIKDMKYRINKYQVVYDDNSRDTVKLCNPIYTDDYESVRAKLRSKHSGLGKRAVGINLDYEELK